MSTPIPFSMREKLFKIFASQYGANLEEIKADSSNILLTKLIRNMFVSILYSSFVIDFDWEVQRTPQGSFDMASKV